MEVPHLLCLEDEQGTNGYHKRIRIPTVCEPVSQSLMTQSGSLSDEKLGCG